MLSPSSPYTQSPQQINLILMGRVLRRICGRCALLFTKAAVVALLIPILGTSVSATGVSRMPSYESAKASELSSPVLVSTSIYRKHDQSMRETAEAEPAEQDVDGHLGRVFSMATAVKRRRMRSWIGPGSSPPTCRSKCGSCTPCKPVHVPIQPGMSTPLEYYPEAWRCKCSNKLYMP